MIEGADRELFERSLRHAVESSTGDEAGPDPAALDAALVDLGWPDALSADPRTAVSLLFEIQGAGNVGSTALDRVLAAGLSDDPPHPGRVLLPPLGRTDTPGAVDGDQLTVHGLLIQPRSAGATLLVVTQSADGNVAVEVPVASLTLRAVEGVDPALDLAEVTGTVDLPREWERVQDQVAGAPVDWDAAVALGQLAVGHELVGIARRMVDQAREHALDRVQFGRPVAAFQAVRHRLAEAFVAIEAADAALADAWLDGSPQAAAMAKASAGRAGQVAGRHSQQVLAGIGYTTEHPFHLYLRRALVLDQLLGSTRRLTRDLGGSLLSTRQVPVPVPL